MADEAGVPDTLSANGFPARSFPRSHHGVPEGEMRRAPLPVITPVPQPSSIFTNNIDQ